MCVFGAPDFDQDVLRVFDELNESLQVPEAVLGAPVPLEQVEDVALGLPVDVLPETGLDPGEENLEVTPGLYGRLEQDSPVSAVVVPPVIVHGPEAARWSQALGEVEAGELVLHVPINLALKKKLDY